MATSILSLFEDTPSGPSDFERRQAAFQQTLSQATDPRAFVAAVGSNLGGQLGSIAGSGVKGLFGIRTPEEEKKALVKQILDEAASTGSDELAQAQRALAAFQANGLGREALITANRVAELSKERDVQNAAQEKKIAEDRFAEYMATADLTDVEGLKNAATTAFGNKQNTLGKMFMEQYFKAKNTVQKPPELRNFNRGDKTIYEQWNPKTNNWEKYAEAPRSVGGTTDNRPEMQRLVEWAAGPAVFNCDYAKDSACRIKVDKYLLGYKRADPSDKVGPAAETEGIKRTMKDLDEQRPAALINRRRIIGIDNAFDLLDGKKGAKPILGSLAEPIAGVARFAALFGIKKDNAVSVTEALKANRIEDAARLLGSGAFGAGTGISDRDLLNAFTQVGAEASLTEEGVRMILQQLRDTVEEELTQYAKDIENTDEQVFKYAKRSKNYYLVDIPKRVSASTVKVPDNLRNLTDAQLEEARREAARTSLLRGSK